jgi:hypothetical protein
LVSHTEGETEKEAATGCLSDCLYSFLFCCKCHVKESYTICTASAAVAAAASAAAGRLRTGQATAV